MIQGLYLAAQGMVPLTQKQDLIANNLANVNTTGYKESGLFLKTFQKYLTNDNLDPTVNREIKPDEVFTNYAEGEPKNTGNTLDLMIKGTGFFTVMTADGIRYTRNGNFSLDPDGYLVTGDGSRVLGTDGYIRVDDRSPVVVSDTGEIMQNGQRKALLRISDFAKPYQLLREGNGYFTPQSPDEKPSVLQTGYKVLQGYLEGSNVSTIRNMVRMIATYRNYEADAKALQAQDETLQTAVRDVGKV